MIKIYGNEESVGNKKLEAVRKVFLKELAKSRAECKEDSDMYAELTHIIERLERKKPVLIPENVQYNEYYEACRVNDICFWCVLGRPHAFILNEFQGDVRIVKRRRTLVSLS